MPRTFHCVIYLLGSIRNHSVSQRAFASQHGEKAHGFALYGRHRVAGKREGCVLSSAKIKDTFRIIAILSRKTPLFFDKKNELQKQVDFFSIRVLFCVFLLSFQRKVEIPFYTRHRRRSSHVQTRSRTDTHRRIAHSTTLHFLPSPFTSTPNPLIIYRLRVNKNTILTLHR